MSPKRNRSGEYERRKQKCLLLNICFKCSNPKDSNKWKCDACLAEDRRKDRERRVRRASIGLCDCGQPTLPDRKRCESCTEKYRLAQADQRTKHVREGGCITCGKPPMPGLSSCVDCAARATDATLRRYQSNKENEVCPFCGGELNDNFRCKICHENHLRHGKTRWHRQRSIVLEHYGGICVCCGESIYEFLEIDHINGGGTKHRQEIGRHFIEWVIKEDFPIDLQILCANCNRSKSRFKSCLHNQQIIPITKHQKRRLQCIIHYGGKCQCCKEENWAFLEFDHINNDGKKHRKIGKFPAWLIRNNFPDSIQLLCSNCNKAKGLYGTCPHLNKP